MDIHTYFGLSYANYLVLPRTLLQSMPEAWQQRFVDLLKEYHQAFQHVEHPDAYQVQAAEESEYGELTQAQRQLLQITTNENEGSQEDDTFEVRYYDAQGQEHEGWELILIPVPDPIPPYNKGRTYIAPYVEEN